MDKSESISEAEAEGLLELKWRIEDEVVREKEIMKANLRGSDDNNGLTMDVYITSSSSSSSNSTYIVILEWFLRLVTCLLH